jgi:hypothetical protein
VIPVAAHPTMRRWPVIVKRAMILAFDVMSIIMIITGTATTPLTTALQNRAFTGLIGEKLIPIPARVAATIAP